MKAFVAIAVTSVFCLSFGLFVSQNLSPSSDLVALSDDEMMQRAGGKWMAKKTKKAKGGFQDCSVSDCPPVNETKTYTHPLYTCVPCKPNNTARTSLRDYKEEKSNCNRRTNDKGELIDCWTVSWVHSMWKTCKQIDGPPHCPTTT